VNAIFEFEMEVADFKGILMMPILWNMQEVLKKGDFWLPQYLS
jgi:hypothetical protein